MESQKYKKGDVDHNGLIVLESIVWSPYVHVYLTECLTLCAEVEYPTTPVVMNISHEYQKLQSLIPQDIGRELSISIKRELGAAFFSALTDMESEHKPEYFKSVSEKISRIKSAQQSKMLSVSIMIVLAVIFSSALSVIQYQTKLLVPNWYPMFLAASFGCIGSMFSVLQRSDQIAVTELFYWRYCLLDSFIKLASGMFSGVILILLVKSDLAFGFAKNDLFITLLLSLISGFSERFIPDVLRQVESKQLSG